MSRRKAQTNNSNNTILTCFAYNDLFVNEFKLIFALTIVIFMNEKKKNIYLVRYCRLRTRAHTPNHTDMRAHTDARAGPREYIHWFIYVITCYYLHSLEFSFDSLSKYLRMNWRIVLGKWMLTTHCLLHQSNNTNEKWKKKLYKKKYRMVVDETNLTL